MNDNTTAPITAAAPFALTEPGALLGESPRWDAETGELVWIDIWGGAVHVTDAVGEATRTFEVAPPLSSVALTTTGSRVVTQGLCVLEVGESGAPGETRHLAHVPESACMRINDTGVDPQGRLWLGTMTMPHRGAAEGSLWRLDPGADEAVRVRGGLRLANAIVWNPEGTTMYVVDSLRQRVEAHAFAADGTIGEAEVFIEVPQADGMPDGITVDAAGEIWVALAGGSALQRYDAAGSLVETVPMPVSHPTSLALGGPELRDLYVTSAVRPIAPARRAAAVAAGAGALFRLPVSTPGILPHRMEVTSW